MEWWLKFVPVVAIVVLYLSCLYWADRDGYERGYANGRDAVCTEKKAQEIDWPVHFFVTQDAALEEAETSALVSAVTVRKLEGVVNRPYYIMREDGQVKALVGWRTPNFDAMPKVQR